MAKTKTETKSKTREITWEKVFPYILVIGSLIGLYASGVLTVDKIKLAGDAGFHPNCNLNPIFSCTSVMKSIEASAFGFPNVIIGLAGFGVTLTVGMAIFAGANFKRWFWLGLEAGTIFGLIFVHWLFYHTVYDIRALCIYCMIIWSVTIPMFWYTTLYNIKQKVITLPKSWKKVQDFAFSNHLGVLLLWYMLIAGLILKHFWYFFGPK